jgi:aminoglycoside phosphotransferase (APT) family kinase protein
MWAELAAERRVLTHFDFWSGNVLWNGSEVSGVVDWTGAGVAPAGFDVGWCRLDIALLYGVEYAELFLQAFERETKATVQNVAVWDLFAAARSHDDVETWTQNYAPLGRDDMTPAPLLTRHERWASRAATRHLRRTT